MPIAERGNLVSQALQRASNVVGRVGRVGRERLLQVVRDTVVVDDDSGTLAKTSAVDARDGLQQLRFLDRTVEVHDTLDLRVETGQQHRLHDEERERIALLCVSVQQWLLETPDQTLLHTAVGPLLPGRIIVVAAGDDGCELDLPQ